MAVCLGVLMTGCTQYDTSSYHHYTYPITGYHQSAVLPVSPQSTVSHVLSSPPTARLTNNLTNPWDATVNKHLMHADGSIAGEMTTPLITCLNEYNSATSIHSLSNANVLFKSTGHDNNLLSDGTSLHTYRNIGRLSAHSLSCWDKHDGVSSINNITSSKVYGETYTLPSPNPEHILLPRTDASLNKGISSESVRSIMNADLKKTPLHSIGLSGFNDHLLD